MKLAQRQRREQGRVYSFPVVEELLRDGQIARDVQVAEVQHRARQRMLGSQACPDQCFVRDGSPFNRGAKDAPA